MTSVKAISVVLVNILWVVSLPAQGLADNKALNRQVLAAPSQISALLPAAEGWTNPSAEIRPGQLDRQLNGYKNILNGFE